MSLTDSEQQIRDAALAFARKNKKSICSERTNSAEFVPDEFPVSVFMAGSPGAGKTESSMELVAEFEARPKGTRILRIDPDDLRCLFPGYDGSNSYLFQGAVSTLVDRMLDLAHQQSQSFILDGTLSDYERAKKNVLRGLNRKRTVQILYVYQDPILAWDFVKAREASEGRRVPVERFCEQYFAARSVVNALKREFGAQIKVDLLLKPNDATPKLYRAGIDQIDYHVPETYDFSSLLRRLSPG
jgi:UDP-N-acetylglucosamine kinase